MNARERRMAALRNILNEHVVTSQIELLRALKMLGYTMTQGTLSRDLHQMHVAKLSTPQGKRYILPEHPLYKRIDTEGAVGESEVAEKPRAFVGVKFSGNMAVVSTRAGYASAIASEIDSAGILCVVGTIAGDDTVLVILAEGTPHEDFRRSLDELLMGD